MATSPRRSRVLGAALVAVVLTSGCGNVVHPAAAVVGGARITDAQLRHTMPVFRFLAGLQQGQCGQAAAGEAQPAACARFTLSELIQQQAALAYAGPHHLAVSRQDLLNAIVPVEQQFGGHAALVHQMATAHVSFDQFSDLVSAILLIQKVAQAVTAEVITRQQLLQRYRQEQLQFTVLHVAHILVRSKDLAVRIAEHVTPKSFARFARKYSTDPGSGPKGGDLGVNRATALDPTFVRAALSLRPGEISGPVHTQFGWHVIRLISARVVPFGRARSRLLSEFTARGFTTWLARQAGDIDVNPRYGRFDPATGRVAPVCSTSAEVSCPSPSAS